MGRHFVSAERSSILHRFSEGINHLCGNAQHPVDWSKSWQAEVQLAAWQAKMIPLNGKNGRPKPY
jgi:hypothetical protein